MGKIWKVGLALLVFLLLVATASAADVTVTFKNNATNKDIATLILKDVTNNTAMSPNGFVNVTYRDTFEIEVNFVHPNVKDGKIDILIYRGSDLIATFSGKKVGDIVSVDTESYSMLPAWYTIKVRYTNSTSGAVYVLSSDKNISTFGFKPIYLSVDPSEYEMPIINYEIKNPSNKIAIGDKIRIKIDVWGKNTAYWYFERWSNYLWNPSYNATSTGQGVWGWINGSSNHVSKTIEIDTFWLANNTTIAAGTGLYDIKVKAGESSKTIPIELQEPTITTLSTNKAEIVPGDSIKISGSVNLVKTGDDADAYGDNYVYLVLVNTTTYGTSDLKVTTSGNVTLGGKVVASITSFTDNVKSTTVSGYLVKYVRALILSDQTFEKSVKLAGVKTGEDWTAFAIALPVTNTVVLSNVSSNLNDSGNIKTIIGKDYVYFSVVKPKIEFTMTKTTFARGEDFKVKGKTNLPEGSTVYIVVENANEFTSSWDGNALGVTDGKYLEVQVSADGSFVSPKITVRPSASMTTYNIYAVWLKSGTPATVKKADWDVYETLTITVTKHKLEAYIKPDVVTPGGKVTIYGNTTADKVYIYTDEANILENVKKKTNINLCPPNTEAITVSNGRFSKQFKVITTDTGVYTIYVFAPANTSCINEASDAQVQLTLQVTQVKYNDTLLPSEITMVRGQKATVKIKIDGSPDSMDNVTLDATLKGQGISVDVAKGETPDSNGWVEFDVLPYYNSTLGVLTDKQAYNTSLAVGMYTLKLKLYYSGDLVENGIKEIPFKVVAPTLNVSVPSKVVKGETLKITVNTNRGGGYDHIWVVLKAPMKTYVQRITTDENGTAIAEFETAGLTYGTYTVYVRDTLGTYSTPSEDENYIKSCYDISPANPLAKNYRADDDVLAGPFTVQIVKAAAVTTTTVPTTTVTKTVTTTVPTTTTTTTVTTTATTTATAAATTATTTKTKPTPGFEAIFAIAGLLAVAYLLRRRQ